ncbi:MAG: anaerobic ribonucleoside-triphosphate reductase activating protein [Oscillospiraceae bacterium]|jgi:anaerobic ribonucleoside-triphosphate reductase activating protein|nr:anaerobic ribonucleoside-triphosphate reductase activating protein [Oscillospiraceae bacterium]
MRIAGTVQDSIVDGPGFRFAVFAQGCELCCEGCHNPGTWDIGGGEEAGADELIAEMLSNPMTDGLTLSGGEPFLQAGECVALAGAARGNGLNVWVFTGFSFEELLSRAEDEPAVRELLELTDVLVDGPFKLAERTLSLKWRGSRNQRIIDVPKSLETRELVPYGLICTTKNTKTTYPRPYSEF